MPYLTVMPFIYPVLQPTRMSYWGLSLVVVRGSIELLHGGVDGVCFSI